MRFLITGITGFAGPHLANLLYEKNHEVHGLIRHSNGRENDIREIVPDKIFKKIIFHYADLRDYRAINKILTKEKFSGIFHLAAQSHPPTSFNDPLGTFNENIIGSANLMQAISDNQVKCKLMFCSTSEVYGNIGRDKRKISYSEKLSPSNPYGVSKAAIDLYMQERLQNKKINGFITRAFSHTGPRRGMNFSISSDAYQLARIAKGFQKPILEVGNLESVRVVIDVRDTVNAYYLAMINKKVNGDIFNVCGNKPKKMIFFTDELIKISGLKKITKKISAKYYRKIDIDYQHGDSKNLKEKTGWEPQIKIEKTLEDLYRYWFDKIK
jgi:GDPmannose 4,6-dehydratase